MESIHLPLNNNPPIIGYSSHAKALAILGINNDSLAWYHSNYIQLCCKVDFNQIAGVPLDFFIDIKKDYNYYLNNPIIFTQTIRRDLVESCFDGDIVAFVKNCLDRGYYFDSFLNQFHVPYRGAYQRSFILHDNLIYGYDDQKKELDIYGFGYNHTFINSTISYDEFASAYHSCPIEDYYKSIYLYHIEKDRGGSPGEKYIFDVDLVIQSLTEYISSYNSSKHFSYFNNSTDKMVFGLSCYDSLINNLATDIFWDDIRPLHLLWEHKKCMISHCQYMFNNNFILDSMFYRIFDGLHSIEKEALILRNLQLKLRITKNDSIKLNILDRISLMQKKEELLYKQLLNAIIS